MSEKLIPPIPKQVRLATGGYYELPLDGVWRLPDCKPINTNLLAAPSGRDGRTPSEGTSYHPEAVQLTTYYLAESLSNKSSATVANYLSAFCQFERWLAQSENGKAAPRSFRFEDLSPTVFDSFQKWASETLTERGQPANTLRNFYSWAAKEGYRGFSRQTAKILEGMQLDFPRAGVATRLNDPRKSALSFEEYAQLADALQDEVGGDQYRPHRAVVELSRNLGLRTSAMTSIKQRDLRISTFSNGRLKYTLTVRRVKQSAGGTVQTVDWPLNERTGALLVSIGGGADTDLPLFQTNAACRKTYIRRLMNKWVRLANLVTTRVPSDPEQAALTPGADFEPTPLILTPYRLRRTLATMLHLAGASPEEIAAALDDDTLEMALIYTANTSATTDLLARTLDKEPEWLAMVEMFKGEIAALPDSKLCVILGGVPYFRNFDEFADLGEIGRCANPKECKWNPPLHCYVCRYFRASVQRAPHERQLVQLRSELSTGVGEESDRLLGVFRRVDGAITQLLHFLTQGVVGQVPVWRRIKEQQVTRNVGAS
jgi:integrase